jgi:integrase
MPHKRRPENRGLPARWQLTHGAYYYRVKPGLEALWDGKRRFLLGHSLPDAYKVWAERVGRDDKAQTIAQLLDRYALQVIPAKAPTTRAGNLISVGRLREVFGDLPVAGSIKPQTVYQYVDKCSVKRKDPATGRVTGGVITAHRDVEVLSHAFTKAVEWGYIDRHPFKGEVRLEGEAPRTRLVEDWEVIECLALSTKRKKGSVLAVQASMRIKLVTGMARSDLLRLRPSFDFKEDGIHIQRHKTAKSTGKRTIYEWTPELRAGVAMALAARPVDLAPWLFCNRQGECYIDEEKGTANGWDSMWGRFMERVLAETKVTERFTEHDLRAKCASDAGSLEHARALLSHADDRMTKRAYRRAPERVRPLR